MSKAFTTNDEGVPEPPKRASVKLAPGEVRYVTAEGRAALGAELERLRSAAKDPDIEARIAQLSSLLELLTVAPPLPANLGRVVFGAYVELEDEDGNTQRWRIVGPDEADAAERKLSVASPLARAILGKRAGDTVTFERPRGAAELTIVSVSSEERLGG